MTIEWDKTLESGLDKIDEQHKKLFDRFGLLLGMLSTTGPKKKAVETFTEFLSEYVEQHFRDEEELMWRFHYPEMNEHKREHEKFASDLEVLKARMRDGDGSIAVQVIEVGKLASDWFKQHIYESDLLFIRFLKERKILTPSAG